MILLKKVVDICCGNWKKLLILHADFGNKTTTL